MTEVFNKQDKLTSGTGITIDENNVISSSAPSYTFTNGLTETNGTVKLGGDLGNAYAIFTCGSSGGGLKITSPDGTSSGINSVIKDNEISIISQNSGDHSGVIQLSPQKDKFLSYESTGNIESSITKTTNFYTSSDIEFGKSVDIRFPGSSGTLALISDFNTYLNNYALNSKNTFQTTAPTSEMRDGGIHIVYLESEPETKYYGYIYLIKEVQ